MKTPKVFFDMAPIFGSILLTLFAVVILAGCNLPSGTADVSSQQTQIAMNVQLTSLAQQSGENAQATAAALLETQVAQLAQATMLAQQATQLAQPQSPTQTQPDTAATQNAQATQIAMFAQATVSAGQLTQIAAAPTITPLPTEPPPTEPPPTLQPGQSFEDWLSSASILLYEDMAGDFSTTRYVKQALDALGLRYVDVKDALGDYKSQLLSGGPGGAGWDLIVSAKELRTAVQGEFYVYLNDALNQGSSVIIEEWDTDDIGLGKLSILLMRCGVEFQADWFDKPLAEQLLWPVEGTHPILHTPNEGISLRNPTGFWMFTDLGDFLRLAPGSSAVPLWSARTNTSDSYLTAVNCLDGRMIIQTYSSHSYGQDRVVLMWQNYIYYTLQARFAYLQ